MKTKQSEANNILKPLRKILSDLAIQDSEFEIISEKIEIIELKKNEVFCSKGKKCKYLGFLFEGLLMAHYDIEEKDFNVSRFFYLPKNILVTSFDSYRNQTNSIEEIVAIEESKLACISLSNLEMLYDKIPALNKSGRLFAEQSYINALERIHDLQSHNNEQRVKNFYNHNKDLYNRLPKTHIASYLGINRNDLSKIVSKIE